MKKNQYLAVLVTLLCINVFGQKIITIKNQESGEFVESAALFSENPKAFATTNALGQADITSFSGSERIIIQRMGFKTAVVSFAELEKNQLIFNMTQTNTHFDDVVVAATRWNQPGSKLPNRISILSADDLLLNNPQTAADLLGNSGEVFIQKSQQGGGSPMIRGFSANRLLYAVDGIRMNNAIFRGGNLQNVISLDPFNVERAEVLFGPGSVLYGSDALGAVMSFNTLKPEFSLNGNPLVSGSATTRISTANNELTNHFHVKLGLQKWASVTSFTHNRFGDLRMGSFGPDEYLKNFYVQRIDSLDRVFENADPRVQNPSGYSQINMLQKLSFRPNQFWTFDYAFHYSETSDYARNDRMIEQTSDGLPRFAVWNYGPQIWRMNNLSINHSKSNWFYDVASLRLAVQDFEESRIDRRFNHHRLRTQVEQIRAYSANLDFQKNIKGNPFSYGVEFVLNDVTSLGSAVNILTGEDMAVADRYPQSQWMSNAAYINYQHALSEKLSLQAGARYNIINIQSDFTRNAEFFPFDFTEVSLQNAATTGSLGLIYLPDKYTKISLNAGTGFRAPNVDDIGKVFESGNERVVLPNPDLSAEYAYNVELGLMKVFKEKFKIDASVYYTYLDKAMVRRPFSFNGQDSIMFDGELSQVLAIQNAAFATVYGVNIGFEAKLPEGFGILGNFNYQLGEEEMENGSISRSRHAAPMFGVLRLKYDRNKLRLQASFQYAGEVSFENLNEEERTKPEIYALDQNGNPYSPSWYTLNFNASYAFHKNFTVSAGLENITDQRYRPYSSGLVAPGRNFIIALTANF